MKPATTNAASAADKQKSIRMARALLDEGYSKEHVYRVLTEKGFTLKEIDAIIRAGNQEMLDNKLRQNRNILIGVVFVWFIGIAAYWLSDHTVTEISPDTGQTKTMIAPGWLAMRFFLSLSGFSLWIIIRQIVLFVKSTNNEIGK